MVNPNPFLAAMVTLQIPKGMGTQISVEGFNLDADEKRCVVVPSKYAADLMAQGLTEYVPPAEKK